MSIEILQCREACFTIWTGLVFTTCFFNMLQIFLIGVKHLVALTTLHLRMSEGDFERTIYEVVPKPLWDWYPVPTGVWSVSCKETDSGM